MSDAAAAPDPSADPAGYQRFLLAALGDDEPGEAQSSTPAALRALVVEAGTDLRTRPAASESSVPRCVGHIVDAEVVMSGRYRFIEAQDEPPLVGDDRVANVAMWRSSTPAQRARVGLHAERGPESYDLSYRTIGGHDRVHLGQARRTLEDVRRST